MAVQDMRELLVYRRAFYLAQRIFDATKSFPPSEQYALTSQIRRSSRSVALNLREAWAKRRYENHFISKLTECDGENSETETALDFAFACQYLTKEEHSELISINREVGKMLGYMLRHPKSFTGGLGPKTDT